MNLNTAIANVATKIKDIASPYKLEDSEIEARIIEAIKDYSKRRPMKKWQTIAIESGTALYDLEDDFIHEIDVPTADTYLSADGEVRITPDGLVPVGNYPSEYSIEGMQIRFLPTPTSASSLPIKYAGRHMSSAEAGESGEDADKEYPTIPVIDEDLIELKTSALCLETLAVKMANDNFKYSVAMTTEVDKTKQAADMRAMAHLWNSQYEDRILRPSGIRS